MTTNTLVLYAMWGTLSATVGAWVVALAKLIWQANEQAKMDVKVRVSGLLALPMCSSQHCPNVWLQYFHALTSLC